MKKKRFAFLLAIALLCALCACGGQSTPEDAAGEPDAPSQEENGQMPEAPVTPGDADIPENADAPGDKENVPETGNTDAPKEEEAPPAVPEAEAPAEPPEKPAEAPSLSTQAPEPPQPPAQAPAPAEKPAEVPPAEAEKPAAPAPEPELTPSADPKTVAEGLIGRPVSELYAAIGHPSASDYAPSCLVEGGEDGELTYNGFVVYTTREAGNETVYAVL